MASNPYFQTLRKILDTYFNTSNWYVMLLLGHAEDVDNDEFASQIEADEIAATGGYSTGGVALGANPSVVYTPAQKKLSVTFPELIIPNATINATHAVYKKEIGASGVDELGLVNNFGGAIVSTNGNYRIPAATFEWDFPN